MKLEELENKKILIVGKGVEGEAAFKFLQEHLTKAQIEIVDKKDGEKYLDNQKNYDLAIKSPGVKASFLKIPYTTVTNIFLSNAKGKIIGVTGTKGKSTTSTLIYKILEKQGFDVYFGGNIGQSPLEFLDKLSDQSWTVLEMSSFQLKDATKSPNIAVMLMVVPEHGDFHKSINDYIEAKRNIFRFQKTTDYAVINSDYPTTHESDIYTEGQVYQISRERECDQGCYLKDSIVWLKRDGREEKIISASDIKLLGEHNLENVCAAVMAAVLAGVTKETIMEVLEAFKGLEHRLEFVAEKEGIRFYNDTLATVPQATIQALETLKDTQTLIAGGYDRGVDYSELGKKIAKSEIKTLILFPLTGQKIWQAVCGIVSKSNLPEKFEVTSMKDAVRIAFAETSPGKICLLSPASASFGIFKNYKDRGNQFKEAVNNLK